MKLPRNIGPHLENPYGLDNILKLSQSDIFCVFDDIDEVVYIADPKTYEILYVNKKVKSQFGDVTGKRCHKVFQGLDDPCSFCTNKYIFGNNGHKRYTWEFQNNINDRWYRCIDEAIDWTDGRKVRFEMAIDITKLKEMEQALRKCACNYRQIFNSVNVMICVLDPGTGKILDVNSKAGRVFGWCKGRLEDIHLGDFISREPPYTTKNALKWIHKAAAGHAQLLEWLAKDKRGRPFWVEVNLKSAVIDGKRRVLAVLRDINARKAYQERLQHEELRYRAIVEDQTELICRFLPDTTLVFVNEAYCRFFSKKRSTLVGQKFLRFIPEAERLKVINGLSSLSKDRPVQMQEHRVVDASGKVCWVSWTNHAIYDKQGNIVECQAVGRDVTERRNTQEKLLRISKAIESSNEAIGMTDAAGVHFYHNRAFTKLFGYKTPEDLQSAGGGPAAYVDRDVADDVFATIMAGKPWAGEVEMISKAGIRIPVSLHANAVKNDNGQIIGLIGIHTDITQRKRAEIVLKESERRYRSIFEDSKDAIVITTRDGDFIDANEAALELFGYTKSQLMKINIKQLYYDTADRLRLVSAIEEDAAVKDFGVRYKTRKGRIVDCLVSANVRCDAEGKAIGYQGIIHDITAQKRTEGQLKKSLEKSQRIIEGTIRAMATALEMRDSYTAGHQRRVSKLAAMIAKAMGLVDDKIEAVRVAGILHDIGKIYVPAEILAKPRHLSDMEMNIIKEHARVGYEILKAEEFPWPIANIVLQHHERIDGSGYPNQLSGNAIMLEARILGVADIVEAMASHRPYRAALGIDKALDEIRSNMGKLYDRDVSMACLKLFERRRASHIMPAA